MENGITKGESVEHTNDATSVKWSNDVNYREIILLILKNAKSRKIFLNKIAHVGMKYWKERINTQISMIRLNGVMWENEKDK